MRSLFLVTLCLVVAVVSWGIYGPTLGFGHGAFGRHGAGPSGSALIVLRPAIVVGAAYALVSLLTAGLISSMYGDRGRWSMLGILWGLAAGTAAAVGLVGTVVILALGGQPIYVMPLIFSGVPLIATLVTTAAARRMKELTAPLLAGAIMVAIGAVFLVLFRPKATSGAEDPGIGVASFMLLLAALAAVLFLWGVYPLLIRRSETQMGGSHWRPTVCVGLVSLVLAVVVPAVLLGVRSEPSQFTLQGTLWCLVAGTAAAGGGLAIVAALASGGKPVYIMPLVFAAAPLVATSAATAGASDAGRPGAAFLAGLILIISGTAMVLGFAPRGSRRKAKTRRKRPAKAKPVQGAAAGQAEVPEEKPADAPPAAASNGPPQPPSPSQDKPAQ